MSAFGQAGFGSRNRRNQLRAQGQMDPYGQQVRAAKQAPTFNVYQTQGTQQATGQPQAPSQSQPAQQPAAAQPSLQLGAPAMPAYQQAQPIQPQSMGTPYSAPPKQDWLQSMSDDELKKSLSSWTAAGTSGTGGAFVDANLKAATAELARRGQSFDATGARRQQLQGDVDRVNRQISDWNDRAQPGQPRIGETFLVNGQPDQQWMQANQYWADQRRQAQTALDAYNSENPVIQTGGPGRMRTPEAGPSAGYWDRDTWIQTGGPGRASPGAAQPIQPQSQGTPYGADPGYADRVAAAAQQWNNTPAGSQKVDWEGNSVRRGLAEGYSLDMITRGLGNTGRFAADPEGAAKFANQVEQDWIASLSSGLPQKPGPNATASEVSAYFNASEAYGRQQKAQQARDERIAAEAAFNDPARSAAGWRPSGEYYNSRGQRFNGIIRNPSSAYRMDASGNLVPYSTQATSGSSSGTPGQAQPIQPQTQGTPYPSAAPQSPATQVQQTQVAAPVASQTMGNTPGQAQPIQPQSQGTPYAQELVSAPVGGGTGLFTPEQARVQREAEQQRLETQAWLDSQNNLLAQIEADALARPGRDAQMRAAQQEAARNQTQRDQQDLSAAGVRELLNEANRAKANIADLQASISSGRIGRDEFDRLMIENNKTLARANANAQVRRLLG